MGMSFDLYVFDMDTVPDDFQAIGDLLEDGNNWDTPLTPTLAAFVSEMEARYPGLDDDPDESPWASWPLTQSMVGGRCCAFNIAWSASEAMTSAMVEAAASRGLTVYDPQGGSVVRPPGGG